MADGPIIVDARHWLEPDGSLPASGRIRVQALRMAQCIEYGATLARETARETLIACRRRPKNTACPGLMWVSKEHDDAILAFCIVCRSEEFLIHDWQDTEWADGPMEAVDLTARPNAAAPPDVTPVAADLERSIRRLLDQLGSSLTAQSVANLIANANNPSDVLPVIFGSAAQPPSKHLVERLLPLMMEIWNNTPRPDLAGRTPSQMRTHAVPVRATEPKVGRNDPCPCGSGLKHKKCCLKASTLN